MNKLIIGLVGSLAFFLGIMWLAIEMAMPLFTAKENLQFVRFSWLGLPLVGTYAFLGLMGANIVAISISIKHKKQIMRSSKFLLIPTLIAGLFGLGVNYANYFMVIKPLNLKACTLIPGYRENLLLDYVKDISECEKRDK